MEQSSDECKDELTLSRINYLIIDHIYKNECILMNQYFLIDASDEQKYTTQFENLKSLFKTFYKEMEGISNSLKRKTFE